MTLKFRKFKAKDERNMFKVTINFSDRFDDKTIHWELPAVNLNEASIEIERLAIFLEKCKNRYPNGKGGLDDFTDIPDYYRYFCEEEESIEIWKNMVLKHYGGHAMRVNIQKTLPAMKSYILITIM